MCGRFSQQRPASELAEIFAAEPLGDDPRPRYNVAPNAEMAALPDRRPVVVREAAWARWLDSSLGATGELFGLFEPSNEIDLRIWPVRPLVNNVRNDGPELFEPLPVGIASVTGQVQ